MNAGKLEVTTPADRIVRLVRAFEAPRRLVWDAHTKPELLKQWLFGPDEWVLERCVIDLRVGGSARFELRNAASGEVMGWTDTYKEIEAPARIVMTEVFDEDWTGGETLVTSLFHEKAAGRTTLEKHILFSSNEAREAALRTGMAHGMETGYARIDAFVASGAWG